MEREEVPVTTIEPGDRGPAKANGQYFYDVVYVLEDGWREPAVKSCRLLRDAKQEFAELPQSVDNVKVIYRDGRMIGTRTTFRIGA